MLPLILGSSSPFRAALLEKLRLPFTTASPDIDESPLSDESAAELVERLSQQKAQAIAQQHHNALIIGSDQVAVLDGDILGKPGNYDNAFAQLSRASGKTVHFLTGLTLLNSESGQMQSLVEPFDVTFRSLSDGQIAHYLTLEEPFQCAGSFKSEGLGITLFESLHGDDPNSLIGLPLIQLYRLLENEGVDVLTEAS